MPDLKYIYQVILYQNQYIGQSDVIHINFISIVQNDSRFGHFKQIKKYI